MSEKILDRVIHELRWFGLNAVTWDSGGGVVGIGIAPGGSPPDELRFFFGTADLTWAGEVFDEEGETVGEVRTAIASDAEQPREIAAAILQSIADMAGTRPH